ncbi:aminotransferase class I/II-fold pyridoxal phosphate-dependent enzyme [Dyadobacter jejuensis]|nr:aminotransferase class I/II-fold pyridoxal phosphate-dependent enzyme [Dyadobacter jejuensis]
MIWLSPPHLSGREAHFVKEAFDWNWVAPVGPNIDFFEVELGQYVGKPTVVAASSGTAALHLALMLLGVGSGDSVICSSLTFVASANPILYQGAYPLFVDSEPDGWNMCPEALETALRKSVAVGWRIKAVVLVHLYGMPANMQELLSICERYGVPVIEDAAEALGSRYADRAVGTLGAMGIYSFNGNKIITTSAGGALITATSEQMSRAKYLATQAKDPVPYFSHSTLGYNYRMSNICAGIGRGQLEVLPQRVNRRRQIFEYYRRVLKAEVSLGFQNEPSLGYSNRWLTAVRLMPGVDPERVRQGLWSAGIEARRVWKPLHLQPLYKDAGYVGGEVGATLFEEGLCLPSGSSLSPEDQEYVVSKLLPLLKEEG